MNTSHIHGCEAPDCDRVGMKVQEWLPGYGYQTAYYCGDHLPRLGEPVDRSDP